MNEQPQQDQNVMLAKERFGRIYIAGPMTGIPEHNFPAFFAAEKTLRESGWVTMNPAGHGIVEGADWGDYLRHDLAKLVSCSTIYLLPGWSKSRGVQLELHVAQALGMTVLLAEGAEMLGLEQSPQGQMQLQKDAAAFRQVRQLMGYVQDGSDQTVSLFQDDATRSYFVNIGSSATRRRSYYDEHSLHEAINQAARGEEG